MKTLRKIVSVNDGKWIDKFNKYVVELEFDGYPTGEFWLSEKQGNALFQAFNADPDACDFPIMASSKNPVHGAFERRGEYLNFIWCVSGKYDWMEKKFGPFEAEPEANGDQVEATGETSD